MLALAFFYWGSILGILAVTAFVLMRNRQILYSLFSIFSLSVAGWLLCQLFVDLGSVNSELWIQISLLIDKVIAPAFLAFCYVYPGDKPIPKKYYWVLFSPLLVLGPLNFTDLVIQNIDIQNGKVIFEAGPLYGLQTLVTGIYFLAGIAILIKKYKSLFVLEKKQVNLLLVAFCVPLVGSMVTGLLFANNHNIQILRPLSLFLMVLLITYAMIYYRLFDMRLVVARSVAYILLLITLGSMYSLSAFTLGAALFDENTISGPQQLFNITAAILLAFTFQPLRRFFEKVTDSIFYRDRYDPQTFMSNMGAIMSREIELNRLASDILKEITTQMRLSKADLVVFDNNKIFFEAHTELLNHKSITKEELRSIGRGVINRDAISTRLIPEALNKYNIDVSVELQSPQNFEGYLLLGKKRSGDIFHDNDLRILRILAQELAIAIHNAKSYTQIQNFNKTLQARIDEATKQLREANAHLQDLDKIKNEFISMATHQLNTPLNVIDGYLTMIGDGKHGKLESQQQEYLEKSLHRARLMKRLVNDFLNVSRMENNKFAIEVSPTDLNKLVTEEVNELSPAAKEKEVLLQSIPPKYPVPVIEIDQEKTRQAIMNLIDNAIYYTPKGEVKVYLDTDGKFVRFRVVDNGIGVPEEQKDKLFKKFSRADNAKKERPSGTGVGLYLVKRVVEDQGGSIIFESTEGKGSTFGFRLPIEPIPKAAPEDLTTKPIV